MSHMSADCATSNKTVNVIMDSFQTIRMSIVKFSVIAESLPVCVKLQHIVRLLSSRICLEVKFTRVKCRSSYFHVHYNGD